MNKPQSLYLEAQLTKALGEMYAEANIAPPLPLGQMAETLAGKIQGYGSLAVHRNAEGAFELPPNIKAKLEEMEKAKSKS